MENIKIKGLLPFTIATLGILLDFTITRIALSMTKYGFYEMHAQYNPINSFIIFFSALIVLRVFKVGFKGEMFISLWSLIGFIYNITVMWINITS